MKDHWKKINAEKVSDIIDLDELAADSSALLGTDMWPETFIEELSSAEKWLDAVKVLAHALPRREAVWWACMCATQMDKLTDNESEKSALESAEKWVFKPTEEHRADAFLLAQRSRTNSVGTFCALAAAFSDDTLIISEDQKIDIDTSGFGKMVAGIIAMSAAEGKGARFDQRIQNFLISGRAIACGGNGVIEKSAT